MSSNTYKIGAPLHFNISMKMGVNWRLRSCPETKYLRWYKNYSYARFRIFDNSYKIIFDTSFHPKEESHKVFYKGKWTTFGQIPVYWYNDWVINATNWFDTLDEIAYISYDINDWLAMYETQEQMEQLAAVIGAEEIDYKSLGYEYSMIGDSYCIYHSDDFEEALDDFACKFIAHLDLKDDKFGVLYQVMKYLARHICDCIIDEKERLQ